MSVDISLIIPVYNSDETIGKTLESVINQEVKFKEVLVIDDGSTDDSAMIVKRTIKNYPYIKYIYQENGGVSRARNYGISKASRAYICFLDADDILLSTMHRRLQKMIETDDGKKVYHYNFIQEFPNNVKKENFYILSDGCYEGENFLQKMLKEFSFESKHMVWSYCFDRRYLIENKLFFNEELSVFEDIEFLHRVLKKKIEIVVDNSTLVLYTHRVDSSTQITSEEYLLALEKLWDVMKKQSIDEYQKQYILQLATKTLNLSDFKRLLKEEKIKNGALIYIKNKSSIIQKRIRRKMSGEK